MSMFLKLFFHLKQTKYITVSDFLKNGFVLIVVMFCANVVTQVLQQALGHTNCTTAAHMRIALQVIWLGTISQIVRTSPNLGL